MVKNHKNANPKLFLFFYIFFYILEKTFRSIDSCNKTHSYQVAFPANRSSKMAKNVFICT